MDKRPEPMIWVENWRTKNIIEVPVAHYKGVLENQGVYVPCQKNSIIVSKEAEESEPSLLGESTISTSAIKTESPTPATSKPKPKVKRKVKKGK